MRVKRIGATAALLAITGASGSGKTTLAEKLIHELVKRGREVGALKNSHHRVELDEEGKDSYRLGRAGARITILNSRGSIFLTQRPEEADPTSALDKALAYFDSRVELIAMESFRIDRANFSSRDHRVLSFDLQDESADRYVLSGSNFPERAGRFFRRDDTIEIVEWIEAEFFDG